MNATKVAQRPREFDEPFVRIWPDLSPSGAPMTNDGVEILDARRYFGELQKVVSRLYHDGVDQIAAALVNAYEFGRTTYTFGNGGSASLASHLACDLGKGTAYCNSGKRFRVIAL